MVRILLRRLGSLPIVLLGVSIITFSFTYLSTEDPAMHIFWAQYGQDFTPSEELLAKIRADAGLDKPLPIQYLNWLGRIVRGDLGTSYIDKKPIIQTLARRIPVSLEIGGASLLLALLIAIPLGTLAAIYPYSWIDSLSLMLSNTGVAVPQYWIGPVLILLFSVNLGILPSAGWGTPKHLFLPVLTLFLVPLAFFTRMVRAGLLAVLEQDYIRTAYAKGLTARAVLLNHAFKNAFIPFVTVIGLQITGTIAGSVIVETIFAIPGIGRTMYQAVLFRDLPMIQACTLIFVGTAVVANALADVTYVLLNPAISLKGETRA